MSTTLRDTLLAQAASIGADMHGEAAKAESHRQTLKSAKGAASKALTVEERKAKGYGSPRYIGLAAVGALFAKAGFNDPDSDDAKAFASSLVKSYNESFTAKTEKSSKGGNDAAHAAVVRRGNDAARIIAAMQSRLDHWWEMADSADKQESAEEKKAAKAEAERFTVLADSADAKSGKPAKYRGRPGASIGDIVVEPSKGTTRDALLRTLCLLHAQHGDKVLHKDVVDAVLDNGGRADKPEAGVKELAVTAMTAINTMLTEHGGESSGDGAHLVLIRSILDRIAQTGEFKGTGAPPPAAGPLPAEVNTPKPPQGGAPAAPVTPNVIPPPLPAASQIVETLTTIPEAPPLDDAAPVVDALLGTGEAPAAPVPPPLPPVAPVPPPLPEAAPATKPAPRGTPRQRATVTVTDTTPKTPTGRRRAGLM